MAKALLEETFCIPATATRDLEGFRRWARSDRFPERGRIDYLAGDLEVDMSPEDLYTHGTVKTEIATVLGFRTLPPDADGWVFSPLLGLRFRLRREEVRPGRWSYRLEHSEP